MAVTFLIMRYIMNLRHIGMCVVYCLTSQPASACKGHPRICASTHRISPAGTP